MQVLQATALEAPQTVIVGKHYVDVHTNIKQISRPKSGVKHAKTYSAEQLESVYEYTVTRYSLSEYVAKINSDNDTLSAAVAELADVVLGGK